jgi:DNA-directed RNA polymerase subunit K/omega
VKNYGNVDSKYRFVIIASKRAKELLKGAKARIRTKSRNPIRIAQNEVRRGLVEYEILEGKKEEMAEPEEQIFIGEGVEGEIEEETPKPKKAKKRVRKAEPAKEEEAEEAEEEEAEEEEEEEETEEEETDDEPVEDIGLIEDVEEEKEEPEES